MSTTVCAICLKPLTTGGALTPVHAACLGVDADLLAACKAANSVMSWMLNARLQSVHRNPNKLFATVAAIRAAIAKAERLHTTITDDHTGRDAQNPTTGDDAHA